MQEPHLKHHNEFKEILDDYKISSDAAKALNGLNMVLIVAPTAAGKNTIIKKLLETGNYIFIVSDTTRKPQIRDGVQEENGIQYYFRSEDEMLLDLKEGKFLEAAFYASNVYGISIRELERIKSQNKIAVTDIEIVGTHNVISAKPDAKAVFLVPPSYEDWMKRLRTRGNMDDDELKRRLLTAEKEFQAALAHDYFNYLITDDVEQSAEIISGIVQDRTSPHQEQGKELVLKLLSHLREDLNNSWHS